DAERRGDAGGVQVHLLALEAHDAAVVGLDAGEALDEGRLARAVVADERGDLAGEGLEVDALEHVDRAEALDDVGELDEGGVSHRAPPFWDVCVPECDGPTRERVPPWEGPRAVDLSRRGAPPRW